jgi:hypothetical protein
MIYINILKIVNINIFHLIIIIIVKLSMKAVSKKSDGKNLIAVMGDEVFFRLGRIQLLDFY